MNNTVNRIKAYIDFKNLSVRKFEEKVGFSNGAFASQYKKNKSIGVDKVEDILHEFPDLNPTWLLTGEGDMLLPSSDMLTLEKSEERSAKMRRRFLEERVEDLEKQVVELSSENSELSQITQNLLGRVQELEKGISGQKDNKRKPSGD